ncbi:hypothetical protein BSL78_24465 [Apostichopus japonicus]|uniref:Uncharacterized protein n=1 Tax=Stichopus japonicus TaxID=307972 RepID=A0A2G8JSF9_STIJA|nr:hypothetical protein BSL78_24465 [Apostichopus japonicus]
MENIVDPSKKTKPQKCVVYWINDQQVSTEPLSSVMDKENAMENAVCLIKWRGKGPYSEKSSDKWSKKKENQKLVASSDNSDAEQPVKTVKRVTDKPVKITKRAPSASTQKNQSQELSEVSGDTSLGEGSVHKNQSQELSEVSRDTSLGEGSVHKQLLIRDPNDTDRFSHITVEPTKLYSIQQKALKKDPQEAPLFLLNGVIDLIFPIDVLAASSGLGLRKDGKSGGTENLWQEIKLLH